MGAVLKFSKGRVAVFGERPLFTAQVSDEKQQAIGLSSPTAPDNPQFLLNRTDWLDGLLGD